MKVRIGNTFKGCIYEIIRGQKERVSGMTDRVRWLGLYCAYKGTCFIVFH